MTRPTPPPATSPANPVNPAIPGNPGTATRAAARRATRRNSPGRTEGRAAGRTPPSTRTPGATARGAAALAAVLLMCVGVPVLLIRLGAYPHSVDAAALWNTLARRDDGTLLAAVLTAGAWACWATFTWDVIRETVTALRTRAAVGPVPASRRRGVFTGAAAPMVHAILALFLTGPAVLHATPATAAVAATAPPATPIAATSAAEPAPHRTPTDTTTNASASATGTRTGTSDSAGTNDSTGARAAGDDTGTPGSVTVRRYDTLWRLAERHLGDPERWPELRDANRDRLGTSTLIREGDILRLPAASSRATQQPATVVVHRGDTLSEIADELGRDGWTPTFHANKGRLQPDGRRLTDPDLIHPGWRLTIPADPADPAEPGTQHATPPPTATTPRPARPGTPAAPPAGSTSRPDTPARSTVPASTATPTATSSATSTAGATATSRPAPTATTDLTPTPQESAAVTPPLTPSPAITAQPPLTGRPGDTASQPQVPHHDAAEPADGGSVHPLVVVGGLGGFTAAVTGVSMLMLRRRRHTSLRRARRPGRSLPPPTPQAVAGARALAPVEPLVATVQTLDGQLRRLGRWCVETSHPLPPLAAVHLTHTSITVHLTGPAGLPHPWRPTSPDQTGWALTVPDAQPADHDDTDQAPAPYPLLFAVGSDSTGAQWLLNAETVTALNITGDPDQARDFVRQVTAGLACNPWSDDVNIACVGDTIGAAAEQMAPHRVLLFPDAGAAATAVLIDAADLTRRCERLGVAVPGGRITQAGDEVWPAYALIIDNHRPHPAVDELVSFLTAHPEQTGTAILITAAGDHPLDGVIELAITGDGDVSIAAVGLTLSAATLTHEQAHACAAAMEHPTTRDTTRDPAHHGRHDDLEHGHGDDDNDDNSGDDGDGDDAGLRAGESDAPMPAPAEPFAPWQQYTDVAGALRVQYTRPGAHTPTTLPDPPTPGAHHNTGADHHTGEGSETTSTGGPDGPDGPGGADAGHDGTIDTLDARGQRSGLLPGGQAAYREAAVTPEDFHLLDPHVPHEVAARVLQADPDLDADLAAWNSPDCPLPKLQVLGPLRAFTRGDPKVVVNRKPYYTGLLAYLAAHPGGVTTDQIADAFTIKPSSARSYMRTLRLWLGDNPRTGQRHIPDANQSPAGQARGASMYQVVDLLCDADLLRRLRARAQARGGPHGINDLITALRLVHGRPYDDPGRQGLTWLLEGDRLDHHLLCAIVDIAHIITTDALARGDHATARWAAETSLSAGPDEEIAILDLAAVTRAEGHHDLAAQLIQDRVRNRHDDPRQPPPQLPPRTQTILETHPEWSRPDTAQAS